MSPWSLHIIVFTTRTRLFERFHLSVEKKLILQLISCASAIFSSNHRSETKTNRDSLPRFPSATCNYLEFWLAHCIVYVLCDWLDRFLWCWCNDTQLKTALSRLWIETVKRNEKTIRVWDRKLSRCLSLQAEPEDVWIGQADWKTKERWVRILVNCTILNFQLTEPAVSYRGWEFRRDQILQELFSHCN